MKYNHTECLKLFGGKRVAFEGREAGYLKVLSLSGWEEMILNLQEAMVKVFRLRFLCLGEGLALKS